MRIELPLNISFPTVNAYYLPGPVPTLIDCGLNTPETLGSLAAGLGKAGVQPEEIRRVVVTHPHVDHIGLAGVLAGYGAEIWLSDLAAGWMSDLDKRRAGQLDLMRALLASHGFDREAIEFTEMYYRTMKTMFSPIPPASIRVFQVGDLLDLDGKPWRVMAAPGHTNRQVCFYQPDTRELYSADMLLPKAPVPMIEGRLEEPGERSPGLPTLLDSYRTFAALDVLHTYPGHGQQIENHRRLIAKQLNRIQRRKMECLELVASGVTRLPDLLAALYHHLPPMERLGGLAMLVGYLDLLEAEGKVHPVTLDSERRYQPV